MGLYKPRKVPPVLSAAWINEELAAIATAHNTHAKEDLPNDCIPLPALQNRYSYFVIVIQPEANATSDLQYCCVPVDCTLVKYSATAAACDGTSTFELGYYPAQSDGTIGTAVSLVAAHNFTTAHTVHAGTLSTVMKTGDVVAVVTATDGALALKRPTIALTFKAYHTS